MISIIKSKYLLLIFVFSFLALSGFLFSGINKVSASGICTTDTWSPTGASVTWKNAASAVKTQTFTLTHVYKDGFQPYTSTTQTDSCVAAGTHNITCNSGGMNESILGPQDPGFGYPCVPTGGYVVLTSPPNKVDTLLPVCGTWSGSGPSYTLSGSTDPVASGTSGQSGINVSGGSCTASTGSSCSVTISDVAGNTTACTSPTYSPPSSATVSGYHDGSSGSQPSTSCNAFGWAVQEGKTTNLSIQIIMSGVAQVATGTANGARPDLASSYCSPDGSCGFDVNLASYISDNTPHTITVQARNPDTLAWINLGTTGKTLICPLPAPAIPATPTGLTATAGSCGTGTINVSWTASSGATSYTLRDGATVIYTGTSTSFSHTGLVAGSSHSYTVLATNSSGSSAYSAAVSRTAPAACLVVMSGSLTASNCTIPSGANNCSASLNWSTTNPVSTSSVTTPTNITVANGNSGSTTYPMTIGDRNFYLYNSSQLLSAATSTATCASGTWDGSKCSAASVNGVCLAAHYNCTAGTSANNSEGAINWTWNCNGSGGGTTASCSQPIPPPTNFVSACNGAGTTANLSWTLPAGYTLSYFRILDNTTGTYPPNWIPENVADTGPSTSLTTIPGHNYTAWIHTRLPSGAYSSEVYSSFACVSSSTPDLTASSPTPSTATTGVAQTFSSTISNIGTTSTGAGFTNLFQTSPSSTGASGVVDYPVSGMVALAAGASAGTSKSITFSSAGTMYIRACADKSSAADANGVIVESSDINNCSISNPWTAVTVSPAPVPVVSISANPTSGTVNIVNPALTWSVTNSPTACTASGDWVGSKPVSGTNVSQGVLTTVKTYIYTLTCSNANGSSSPASAAVNVTNPGGGCANGATNYPECTIDVGGCLNGATNPPLCTIGAGTNGNCALNHYSCTSGTSGSNVSGTSAWTWTCTGTNSIPVSCSELKKRPDYKEN